MTAIGHVSKDCMCQKIGKTLEQFQNYFGARGMLNASVFDGTSRSKYFGHHSWSLHNVVHMWDHFKNCLQLKVPSHAQHTKP